jgi:tape measure domain-containing protein
MGIIGNLFVKLGINTQNFTIGLNKASKSLDGFSRKLAGNFKQATTNAKQTGAEFNLFAKQTAKTFKDVGRIVQGIVISQVFYRLLAELKAAAGAVWDMAKSFEQVQLSFSLLIRAGPQVKALLNDITDFAALTPYTFQQVANATRKFLAYGFKPGQIMPIMQVLGDASAAAGDPEVFDRVAKAFGQIHTKGRLVEQELRQLTEAGIPAFDILKEKLGLTYKEMTNIGKMHIPAQTAINALMEGMNERFGGASQALAKTVTGMMSTIKDDLLLIGKDAIQPLFDTIKGIMGKVTNALNNFRRAVNAKGFAAALKDIIPPEIFPSIQLFIANLLAIRKTLIITLQALWPVIRAIADFMLQAFNLLAPVINFVARAIAALAYWLSNATPVARIFIQVLGGLLIAAWISKIITGLTVALKSLLIVKVVAQGIIMLIRALRTLAVAMTTNIWVAVIAIMVAALISLAVSSGTAAKAINALGEKINKLLGIDPSKIFAPKMQDNVDATDDLNAGLEDTSGNLEDMGDQADKAAKKAKDALASFDEVFTLPEPTGSVADDTYTMPEIDVPVIPRIDLSSMEIPDMSDVGTSMANSLATVFDSGLRNVMGGAGLGGIIGGIIGTIIAPGGGTVLGLKIGAVAGGIVGMFWDDIKKWFTVSSVGKGSMIGSVLLGALFPGIGSIFGFMGGGVVGKFMDAFGDKFKLAHPEAKSSLEAFAKTAWDALKWKWNQLWGRNDIFDDNAKIAIKNWGAYTVTRFIYGEQEAEPLLYNHVNQTKERIGKWWQVDLSPQGVGAMQGFLNGMKSTDTALQQTIITTRENMRKWWQLDLKSNGSNMVQSIIDGFKVAETYMQSSIQTSKNNITTWWQLDLKPEGTKHMDSLTAGYESARIALQTKMGQIKGDIVGAFVGFSLKSTGESLVASLNSGLSGIPGAFSVAFGSAKTGVTGMLNKMIDGINAVIRMINRVMVFKVPIWVPPPLGGREFGMKLPEIPQIPNHMQGGLFDKEHIATFAEHNKLEAILPVENPQAMAKVRRAIFGGEPSEFLQGVVQAGTAPTPGTSEPPQPIMYVGTLIADERGLRELNRKIKLVEAQEKTRRG